MFRKNNNNDENSEAFQVETSPEEDEQIKPRKRFRGLKIALLIVLACIITVGITVFGYVCFCIAEAPEFDAENIPAYSLTSYIYDANGDLITKIFGTEDRTYVSIDKVPKVVIDAFVSSEDARFYKHFGVDVIRIGGAFLANLKSGSTIEGASTITMQVAQILYLPGQKTEKTYKRKIQEAYLAIQLERHLEKNEILELYLNIIYFGEGAYGVQQASNTYLGKSVSDVDSIQEAALLSSLPKAPNLYDPFIDAELSKTRRSIIISSMVRTGALTQEEGDAAKQEDLKLNTEPQEADYPHPYFLDEVIMRLVDTYGEDVVYNGGLRVYTTMDPDVQTYVEEALADDYNFPATEVDDKGQKQPEGAAIIMDPSTGYVLGLGGGREHLTKLQYNRATHALRQPGSSFKPIIAYGPAVEQGWGATTVVDDSPVTFGDWSPENDGGGFSGPTTLREAIRRSVNIVAVKTLDSVGIAYAKTFAESLGISTLDDQYDNGLSLALGGLYQGVSVIEMAGAYGAFANQGVYNQPTLITKVTSETLGINDEYKPEPTTVMKETTSYIITSMLQTAATQGTGYKAYIYRPMAGKTGTTDSGKDLWFCGYTPDLVGIVWIGYDTPVSMPTSFGGDYPTLVWRQMMSNALENTEASDFPEPSGLTYITVCAKTGLLPGKYCVNTITDVFREGEGPTEYCNSHATVDICKETKLLATEFCPETETISADASDVPTKTCTTHKDPKATDDTDSGTDSSDEDDSGSESGSIIDGFLNNLY